MDCEYVLYYFFLVITVVISKLCSVYRPTKGEVTVINMILSYFQ